MALRIYLTDLTHVGFGIAAEAFPLNIGLVASYASKTFGKEVEISLFKYPEELLEALRDRPPHILGCSNYTWNCNLSYHFTELAKSINPEILTVWGGTNYPFQAREQENLLRRRSKVDLHIFYEGEQAFSKIIERFISAPGPRETLKDPIDGCQFISPADGSFVSGEEIPRIKNLDTIPSPYTTGLMDKFFDGKLTPMMETSRGCPFKCNFCNAGDAYFTSVNKFSDDYIEEEFTYIAQKARDANVTGAYLADNNFAMIPRDAKTAKLLNSLKIKFNWPQSILGWTGKNSKKKVIEATRLLGKDFNINMAVQSMDDSVLKNTKRANISLEDYRDVAESLSREGRPQIAELITPLPGETLQSQLAGINTLLDTGVSRIQSNTLTMLHGTPYKDNVDFLAEHQYVSKYRLVIRNFSEIENTHIFDVEEVGIATKDMSFEDYLETRKYLFLVEICNNCDIFKPLQRYLKQNHIKNSKWIQHLSGYLDRFPNKVDEVFRSFSADTTSELWDSEEALISHYSIPSNFSKLLKGEAGHNVIYKHRVWMLSQNLTDWLEIVFKLTQDLLVSHLPKSSHKTMIDELTDLHRFIKGKSGYSYSLDDLDNHSVIGFNYDILGWLNSKDNKHLSSFMIKEPIALKFFLDDKDKLILRNCFTRYGTELNGIARLLQRTAGKMPERLPIIVSEQRTCS